ncbi:hypothetical protein [Pseudonocardia parietis]|uniref:Uncharacterized protein n=1 Tax=Pseudonocardia parietis TaxID=570936 RepID=A0ABS4VLC6_9PSEU|nr:hypothetical protein [Pseudonocardia parietis]MBP2364714.1 hypothetical protein [Pseudonocardia parietis]
MLDAPGARYACLADPATGAVVAAHGGAGAPSGTGAGDPPGTVPADAAAVLGWGSAETGSGTAGPSFEDAVITTGASYHLVRAFSRDGGPLLAYLQVDRAHGNLALARRALLALSRTDREQPAAPTGPAAATRPEPAIRPEAATGPATAADPEAAADPEVAARPAAPADPEAAARPAAAADPEAATRPAAPADPQAAARPAVPAPRSDTTGDGRAPVVPAQARAPEGERTPPPPVPLPRRETGAPPPALPPAAGPTEPPPDPDDQAAASPSAPPDQPGGRWADDLRTMARILAGLRRLGQ